MLKRFIFTLTVISLVGGLFCCCDKETPIEESTDPFQKEEVDYDFSDGIWFSASDAQGTKAFTALTSAKQFQVLGLNATTSATYCNARTVTNGSYEKIGSYYWPNGFNLSFFCNLQSKGATNSVIAMTNTTGVVTMPCGTSSAKLAGDEDIITAKALNQTKPTVGDKVVALTFDHILSKIAGCTFTGTVADATTTVTALSISHPKYGTYKLNDGTWSNLGTAESSALSLPAAISGTGSQSSTDDKTVIPGTYTLSVSYTVSINGAEYSYTKTGSAVLAAGKNCTIKASLTNDLVPIQFSTTVTAWVNQDVNVTLSNL